MSGLDKKRVDGLLSGLNQRKLSLGEIVLVAKALSRVIPIVPDTTESTKVHMLQHKNYIEEVYWHLRDHAHITSSDLDVLEELTGRFVLWRTNVAKGDELVLFEGGPEDVIEEITGISRVVDGATLFEVSTCSLHANHLLKIFTELARYQWKEYQHRGK